MTREALSFFLSMIVVTAAAACGAGEAASPSAPDPAAAAAGAQGGAAGVTFHKDVAPVLQKRCQTCHVEGGIAPFPLVSYDDARPLAPSIVDATKSRIMPPWGAHDTADCKVTRPWKDDMRLTDAELATLEAWSAAGAPEGDPKDAPPAVAPPPRDLTGATHTLRPDVGYAMSGTVDQLRCFVIDPKLAKETFINAMQIVPERPEVVHHVLVFADPKGESRAKADANGQYDCFGGAQVSGATLLTAWAPGGAANELPANVAMPLDAGSLIVMQVHYHAAPGLSAPPDRTALQLRMSETPPELFAYTQLLGNFRQTFAGSLGGLMPGPNDSGKAEFFIPPNVKDHTETMTLTMPASLKGKPASSFRLLATGGHMHYVGVSEDVRVKRSAPAPGIAADECLLAIPRWDFDWQRGYRYDVPIDQLPQVLPGDQLQIKCTYDNTLGNPKMGRALREAGMTTPQPVTLGESTLEEMCLASFVFVYEP